MKIARMILYALTLALVFVTAFTASAVEASASDEMTEAVTSSVPDALLTTDDKLVICAIVLCIVFGIIFSFYIIRKMKNRY